MNPYTVGALIGRQVLAGQRMTVLHYSSSYLLSISTWSLAGMYNLNVQLLIYLVLGLKSTGDNIVRIIS